MLHHSRTSRRVSNKSKPRQYQSLQKPNGVISPRVQQVGGEHFAIVCVDPAKHRSEWMMADYFGNVLIAPQTLEHQGPFFEAAIQQIRQAQHFGIVALALTRRRSHILLQLENGHSGPNLVYLWPAVILSATTR